MKRNKSLENIRARLIEALAISKKPPENYQEFCEWMKGRLYDAELTILKEEFEDKEDGHREWVFDLCLESGKFEQVNDDLRLRRS